MAFGTDESVMFREVSLIQGVLIERFHCIRMSVYVYLNMYMCVSYATIETMLQLRITCVTWESGDSPSKVYRNLSDRLRRKSRPEKMQLSKISTKDTASIIVFGRPC